MAQYYVFEVDTGNGDSYVISSNVNFGDGTKVGGPFSTKAAAQAFIKSGGAAKGLSNTVLSQYKADVGDWIVVPEGLVGDVVNALSLATKNPLGDLVGELKGDLNTGSGTTYTVLQIKTAQQAENASVAGLVLYPTKAAAQGAADTANAANNPSQGTSWEQDLENFLADITSANLWIRVGKIVIGATLIIIGVSKITGASNVVTKIAEKAPIPV